jgi:hypothetical protein
VRRLYKSFGVKELSVVVAYFLSNGSFRDTENAGLASQTTDCKFQFAGADKGLISLTYYKAFFMYHKMLAIKLKLRSSARPFIAPFANKLAFHLTPCLLAFFLT